MYLSRLLPVLGLLALPLAGLAAEPSAAPPGSFAQFDRDGDNRLSEEEMRNGVASIYGSYDKDNDGTLSVAELPKMRDASGREIASDAGPTSIEDLMGMCPQIFAKLDGDGDGYLSSAEFAAAGLPTTASKSSN